MWNEKVCPFTCKSPLCTLCGTKAAKLSNSRNAEKEILKLRNCNDDCSIELKEANIGNHVRAVYKVQVQRKSRGKHARMERDCTKNRSHG
jgi:hypothetical protein